MQNKLKSYFLLILLGLIWGSTFPLIKISLNFMSPYTFLTFRFLIATLVLFLIYPKRIIESDRLSIFYGFMIGISLFFGYIFQTVGLEYTTSSHSGLITGLYVVIAPLIAYFLLKEKITFRLIISLFLSILGLILLTNFYETHKINFGDFLTILSAISYAFQIVLVDKYVKMKDPFVIVFFQIFTVGIISIFLLPFNYSFQPGYFSIFSILFLGIVATGLAILLQNIAQKELTSGEASIFLTSEPIFAVIFSYLILGETLSFIAIIGAFLIVISMIVMSLK